MFYFIRNFKKKKIKASKSQKKFTMPMPMPTSMLMLMPRCRCLDLQMSHKIYHFCMNCFIRMKMSTLYKVYLEFLLEENYNPLSKYTIALASGGAVHYNGSLFKLCPLHSTHIFTQFCSTLDKGTKDSCDLKETFLFFLKFIQKVAYSALIFSL